MGKVQREVLADLLGHKGFMDVDTLLGKTTIAVKSRVPRVVTAAKRVALGRLLVKAGDL